MNEKIIPKNEIFKNYFKKIAENNSNPLFAKTFINPSKKELTKTKESYEDLRKKIRPLKKEKLCKSVEIAKKTRNINNSHQKNSFSQKFFFKN